MFSIKANSPQKTLHITIRYIYDEEDLKAIRYMLNREIVKLNPDWTAIVDLRGMRVLEQKLTHYIRSFQETMVDHRVGRALTLVDNKILKMQLERLGRDSGFNHRCERFTDERVWQREIVAVSQDGDPDIN